jgi:hypothetical protein
LALTVGIAATGFCYPGGILQLFSSTRSTNFTTADSSSSQIASTEFIINISYHLDRQDLHRFVVKNRTPAQVDGLRDKSLEPRKSIYNSVTGHRHQQRPRPRLCSQRCIDDRIDQIRISYQQSFNFGYNTTIQIWKSSSYRRFTIDQSFQIH